MKGYKPWALSSRNCLGSMLSVDHLPERAARRTHSLLVFRGRLYPSLHLMWGTVLGSPQTYVVGDGSVFEIDII